MGPTREIGLNGIPFEYSCLKIWKLLLALLFFLFRVYADSEILQWVEGKVDA